MVTVVLGLCIAFDLAWLAGCLAKPKFRVTHELLFVGAHLYYGLLPIAFALGRTLPLRYGFVYALWDKLDEQQTTLALLVALASPAFLIGSKAAMLRRGVLKGTSKVHRDLELVVSVASESEHHNLEIADLPEKNASWLLAPLTCCLALSVVVCLRGRKSLFGAYKNIDRVLIENDRWRAFLSGLAVLATAILLCYLDARFFHQLKRRLSSVVWRLRLVIVLIGLLIWTPLLIAGGRGYVATSMFILLVYWSTYIREFDRKKSAAFFLVGGILAVLLGSVRVGENPNAERFLYYASTEALLTSPSMFGAIADGKGAELTPLRLPVFLASDLANLAPRLIFPNKDSLRLDPKERGFSVVNPLGAFALQLSLLINFGWLGGMLFLAVLGYAFSRILEQSATSEKASSRRFWRIAYAATVAWIPFSFFRDPFSISLIRGMLGFGVISPLILLQLPKLVSMVNRKGFENPVQRK
jgi:oligosaccharide repeat unit polymerase